jgi:hypothetical protein
VKEDYQELVAPPGSEAVSPKQASVLAGSNGCGSGLAPKIQLSAEYKGELDIEIWGMEALCATSRRRAVEKK